MNPLRDSASAPVEYYARTGFVEKATTTSTQKQVRHTNQRTPTFCVCARTRLNKKKCSKKCSNRCLFIVHPRLIRSRGNSRSSGPTAAPYCHDTYCTPKSVHSAQVTRITFVAPCYYSGFRVDGTDPKMSFRWGSSAIYSQSTIVAMASNPIATAST